MTRQIAGRPRFVARQIGPRCFVAHDNVSELDYDMSFTREAAQRSADRRNAASSTDPLVEVQALLAERHLRIFGRDRFEQATRRAAWRGIRTPDTEEVAGIVTAADIDDWCDGEAFE
jgi:hypothetical protein